MLALDLAYIAGFIDGEGCLTTVISYHKARGRIRLTINLVITNTDLSVLNWVKESIGAGRVSEKKYEKHRKTSCWAYVLDTNKDLIVFLNKVKPYIRIKKVQVDHALNFLESRERRAFRSFYTEEEIESLFLLRRVTQRQPGSVIFYKDKPYDLCAFRDLVLSCRSSKYSVFDWTEDSLELLGKDIDRKVAENLGVSLSVVQTKRDAMGIVPFGKRFRVNTAPVRSKRRGKR